MCRSRKIFSAWRENVTGRARVRLRCGCCADFSARGRNNSILRAKSLSSARSRSALSLALQHLEFCQAITVFSEWRVSCSIFPSRRLGEVRALGQRFLHFAVILLGLSAVLSSAAPHLLAQGALPSSRIEVRGRVLSTPDLQPVSQATVTLTSLSDQVPQSVETDQGGGFSFHSVSASGFRLDVIVKGYKVGFRTEEFGATSEKFITILLDPVPEMQNQKPGDRPLVSVRELSIPGNARQAFEKGVRELNRNRPADSLAHFQKATELYRDFDEAYVQWGLAYYALGQWTDASAVLEKGIEVYSANARAHALLGKTLLLETKFAEAIAQLKEAISLDDRIWSAHVDLGNAFLKVGNTEGASEQAVRSRELRPAALESHLLFYNVLIRQLAFSKALTELDGMIVMFGNLPIAARLRETRERLAQRIALGTATSAASANH